MLFMRSKNLSSFSNLICGYCLEKAGWVIVFHMYARGMSLVKPRYIYLLPCSLPLV